MMTRKNLFITTLFLGVYFLSHSLYAQSANSEDDKITGVWFNESKDMKFEVYQSKGNLYEAKLIWSSENKPTGKIILKELRFDKGSYSGGKVFAAARGEWVNCKAKLENANTLIITGMKGIFSKSQTWRR